MKLNWISIGILLTATPVLANPEAPATETSTSAKACRKGLKTYETGVKIFRKLTAATTEADRQKYFAQYLGIMSQDLKWFDNSVSFPWSAKYVGWQGLTDYNMAAFAVTHLLPTFEIRSARCVKGERNGKSVIFIDVVHKVAKNSDPSQVLNLEFDMNWKVGSDGKIYESFMSYDEAKLKAFIEN